MQVYVLDRAGVETWELPATEWLDRPQWRRVRPERFDVTPYVHGVSPAGPNIVTLTVACEANNGVPVLLGPRWSMRQYELKAQRSALSGDEMFARIRRETQPPSVERVELRRDVDDYVDTLTGLPMRRAVITYAERR